MKLNVGYVVRRCTLAMTLCTTVPNVIRSSKHISVKLMLGSYMVDVLTVDQS